MKLSVALRLGRVSNLPTVTSNVLAAIALAGGSPSGLTVTLMCVAMSLMYVAGMFLNDAFDREIDARERPERPIPSGEVAARAVFDAGFALLLGGIALTALVALGSGAGWRPILCAIALGALIIFYDAYHKQNPLSPVVMGLCRVGVYATAAFIATRDVDPALLHGLGALLAYLIGLTYVARAENLFEPIHSGPLRSEDRNHTARRFPPGGNLLRVTHLWPLAVLAVPFWLAFPEDLFAAVLYGSWLAAVGRALLWLLVRRIRDAVSLLIAGISLLDATLAANQGCTGLAIIALVAFGATRRLQRDIAGT
jgi:4-hydroxybenzoate polyprenyltransferase